MPLIGSLPMPIANIRYWGAFAIGTEQLSSALCQRSLPTCAGDVICAALALSSALRRQRSPSSVSGALRAPPALWFAHCWSSPPCAGAFHCFTGALIRPSPAVSSVLRQHAPLCRAGSHIVVAPARASSPHGHSPSPAIFVALRRKSSPGYTVLSFAGAHLCIKVMTGVGGVWDFEL